MNAKLPAGRLLIVDDEIELMSALREALTTHGYDVVGLSSGKEALQYLARENFDLLLSDLMMPEMDGITLLHSALQLDPRLVGVIMTGQGTLQTAVDAMKTGAYDYILKPFKLNALLPTLARAMEVRRLRQENVELRETLAVAELSKAIATTLDVNSLLATIADATMRQYKADELSILMRAPDVEEFHVAVVRPESRAHLLGMRFSAPRSPAGLAASSREPLLLEGPLDDRFEVLYRREDVRSSVVVPLLAAGRVIGVLCLNAVRRRPFAPADLKALSVLASTAAAALDNAALYHRVRQAEARYRSIIENAVEGIFQTTPDGRLLTANPALASLFGYSTPAQVLDEIQDLGEQLYVDASCRQQFLHELETNGRVVNWESQVRRRDGERIWISENTRAVRDEQGNVQYYEGMLMDVTERRRSREALEESNRRLGEALSQLREAQDALVQQERLRALGEMASGVAHDFNNALSAILGFTETSLMFPEDLADRDKVQECLTMIDTIARDAAGLVSRLRSFYRPREKDEVLVPLDLAGLVAQTVTLTQPRWKGSGHHTISVQTEIEPVPHVLGNEGELRQVFTNLIFNAVDALPQGGTIVLRACRTGWDSVQVEVSDTGIGMTEETRVRCLEPFYTTKGDKGTGLGLAMVYGAVQRHNGTIDIDTAPGAGTTVRLKFPVVDGASTHG